MPRDMCVRVLAPFFVISLILAVAGVAGDESPATRSIEDFCRFKADTFPEGWKSTWGQKNRAKEVYTVRSSEECYLEARAVNSDVLIAKEFIYKLKEYPFLSWQWRILELPKGGDERYKKTGDSAAGIYVIFPGRFWPDNIKYVWSASLPEGTATKSPYNSKTWIVVLRNQSTPLETWVSEKINVYEDYKRLFGREPEPVQAIGLMSDSDNTKSTAIAHYRRLCITKQ